MSNSILVRPCWSSRAESIVFHVEPSSHCSSYSRPGLRNLASPMAVPERPARTIDSVTSSSTVVTVTGAVTYFSRSPFAGATTR